LAATHSAQHRVAIAAGDTARAVRADTVLACSDSRCALIEPTLLAVPVYFASMWFEHRTLAREGQGYDRADTLASLSGGLGYAVTKGLLQLALLPLMYWVFAHRVVHTDALLAAGTWTPAFALYALLLALGEDHQYYWYHRSSHHVRLLWAGHITHHSSQRYTFGTALRQSWMAPLITPIFWIPLLLVGFHPLHIYFVHGLNLFYQYWVHTETVRKLGVLEWVLNTPSHHRVHHGTNAQYIDKNHAGILIIWDRLYGTFEPEVEQVRYGITEQLTSHHVLHIQTHEFRKVFREAWAARGLRRKWLALFASPGAFKPE
jgi:alkylglycerol monooxygenase